MKVKKYVQVNKSLHYKLAQRRPSTGLRWLSEPLIMQVLVVLVVLDLVIKWSIRNNMELNINKFEYINHKSITHNKNLNMLDNLPFSKKNFNYSVSNSLEICKTPSVRDLGVTVDEELNWKLHIEKVTKSCRQLCGWILSIFHTRDKTTMLTIFNSLVISKLDYCCEIWNPHQIQQIIKIEQIQRAFTSRIAGLREDNYWNRLKKTRNNVPTETQRENYTDTCLEDSK